MPPANGPDTPETYAFEYLHTRRGIGSADQAAAARTAVRLPSATTRCRIASRPLLAALALVGAVLYGRGTDRPTGWNGQISMWGSECERSELMRVPVSSAVVASPPCRPGQPVGEISPSDGRDTAASRTPMG